MNKKLIKEALRAQAQEHTMEAYRQQGSNVIQPAIRRAFTRARADEPSEALITELEREIVRIMEVAVKETRKATELNAEATALG